MSAIITQAQSLAMGDAMRSKALGYASKTGTAIDLVVVNAADAKHEYSLGSIKLSTAIKANLSADEVDALPQPGSRWKLPDGTANNNADICEWKDPSKPDGKPKEISFYVVWSDNTPEGRNCVTELDWLSRMSSENMKIDDIPEQFRSKYSNPQLIRNRKKYLEGRRGTVRKAYKDAVRLIWQLDMVNELDGVGAKLGEDGDNVVLVYNKTKQHTEWKFYSVGAFLKLVPEKAAEQDGSYAALEATVKRQPNGEQNKGGLKLNAVHTPDSADKVAIVLHSYLDKVMSDRKGDDYRKLLVHLQSDGGRQSVLTLGDLKAELDTLFKMDFIKSTYDIEKQKAQQAAA